MSKKEVIILGAVLLLIALVPIYFLVTSKPTPAPMSNDQTTTTTNSSVATESAQLKVEDIKEGEGKEVKVGDTVVMHYNGTLLDGTKFDSSYDRGQPFSTQIGVGRVIQGWDQGVPGMKVGGKRKLIIPGDLAYGPQGVPGTIPPNATLIFEVELLAIK